MPGPESPAVRASAAPFVPDTRSLPELARAASSCEGCDLHRAATQTVFGAGSGTAALMLVGEQPGDVEDRRGAPFVGPAGAVLWECVEEAGIDRAAVWATNAVKHFKFEPRGKRRIHQKPGTAEVVACHPWLEAEVRALRPEVIVALGATAARAVLGRTLSISGARGRTYEWLGAGVVVTYHPSAVLRGRERAADLRAALVADLARAADLAG